MVRKALPFVLLVLAAGCMAKLNTEKTLNLSPGQPEGLAIEKVSKTQSINVSAKAASGKFSVYVFLEKDQNEAEKAIHSGKVNDKIIAHQQKTDSAEFKAAIPANEAAVVMVAAEEGKKAEVKLKVTN